MTPEPTSGLVREHSFFDPNSTYRLLTQTNFWADGGLQSVRVFFERQRRRSLEAKALWDPPESLAWEGSPGANRAVQDYLRAVRQCANAEEERNRREAQREYLANMKKGGPCGPCPVLLTFRLTRGSAVQVGESRKGPGWVFPGIGEHEPPEIRHFPFNQTGLQPGVRCLVLLLEERMVDRLRATLSGPPNIPAAAAGAEDVIGRALAEAAPAGTDAEAVRRANRLQEIWACVEGLELTTDPSGRLKRNVDLVRPARLDPRTRVLLCLGLEPKAA
jgi:hypothetical protein